MLVVYHFPKPPLELSWVLFCYYVVMSYSCISWMLVFISPWHDIVFVLVYFICVFYYMNLWSLAGHMFICYCFIVLIYEFITRCVLEISLYQRLFYHKPSNRKDWNIIDSNWNLVIRNIMISMYFEGIVKVRWHMIFIFIILWRRIMESNLIHLETLDVFLVHNSDPAIR